KRVEDVTTEPGLSTVGHTVARMYDLVREHPEALTYRDDEGRRVSGTWLQPRDRAQLSWRRLFTETIARHTGGLFGRPPDSVPRPGLTPDHVVYFSIPIATPGLRVVARTVYGTGNAFDHPVSRYGDENDCMIVLDDVLVPWERVFSIADESFCATIFPRITEWAHWSILVRLAVKAEVLAGLYALIPDMMGRAQQPQSQEAVGEILRYLITLRAVIHASEYQRSRTAA